MNDLDFINDAFFKNIIERYKQNSARIIKQRQ